MKKFKKNFQLLPFLLITWNTLDIVAHVAVNYVEPLRIVGNVVCIIVASIVWFGITKKSLHSPLVITALLVLILNTIQSYLYGYVIPMLVFIGVSVFLILRLAQVDAAKHADNKAGSKSKLRHRWWIALLAAIIGLLPIALLGENLLASSEPAEASCLENIDGDVLITESGVEYVQTPDECFKDLTDWSYETQYVEIDGLKQAYIEAGSGESGETILLLHGQPSWSYLYRKMIPILVEEGHRVIAMDHLGFGRSDKPIDPDYYSYINHVERLEIFIEELELEDATLFVQDWGSLIGLQVVGTNPDWFKRLVVGNGYLPTFPADSIPFPEPERTRLTRTLFHQAITNMPAQQEPLDRETFDTELDTGDEYFGVWIDYALNDERFRPEMIVEAATYFDLTPDEEAGYAAPFPSRLYMAGTRAFPGLVNELPGVTDKGWEGLAQFNKPFLTIWGDNDSGNLGDPTIQKELIDHIPGSRGWDHVRLEEAGHFLQDDQGEEIARLINEFISQSVTELN